MSERKFGLEVLVDFPDDCMTSSRPITHQHIDSMMRAFREGGIGRVGWIDYADARGGPLLPGTVHADGSTSENAADSYLNCARTYELLGNPLQVAVEAAHRHGLEIYGCLKPYETGLGLVYPEGSPEARLYGRLSHVGGRLSWLDRFVNDNPRLRIARRTDDLPDGPDDPHARPIRTIKLIKKDDGPTRIRAANLQLWVSDLNYRYTRLDAPFTLTESVGSATRDVRDGAAVANIADTGPLLTRQGDRVRVLTVSGLTIEAPYLVVATDIVEGESDFENAATDMIVALDAAGNEILGSVASSASLWRGGKTDFRTNGLDFDYGWGRERIGLGGAGHLVAPGWRGSDGSLSFIGYARGRNSHLPGALCETEPQVRGHWLSWLSDILDTGVDGVDLREENHSTGTDYPHDYGYNPAVLEACGGDESPANIARVRGDAYTEFLRSAKALCAARGKRMRINFQVDYYRPQPPMDRLAAYPANLDFQWRRWIDEGLCDEAILRFFAIKSPAIFDDPVALEIIERCQKRSLPLAFNRYVNRAHSNKQPLLETYRQARGDGRYSGFIIYEGFDLVSYRANDECELFGDDLLELLSLAKTKSWQ